ncbi:MAG: helix-turn-helix transcriptional regulator [Azonexus sp.]
MANTIQQSLPAEGYVRIQQVLAVIPISRSSLWAWCKSGKFPRPIKLGPRTTVWAVSSIRAYLEGVEVNHD